MKKILVIMTFASFLAGCSLLRNNKTGCPTNGKNVGAEKLVSGDKKCDAGSQKS